MSIKYGYFFARVGLNMEVPFVGSKDPLITSLEDKDAGVDVQASLTKRSDLNPGFIGVKNDPDTSSFSLLAGYIYVGCRLQQTLLMSNDFYTICNLYPADHISQQKDIDGEKVSMLIFSHASTAQRLAFFEEVSFTIIPVDPKTTLPPFGNSYPTSTLISAEVSTKEFTLRLSKFQFVFDTENEEIWYSVKPASIKRKVQKKTSATYN